MEDDVASGCAIWRRNQDGWTDQGEGQHTDMLLLIPIWAAASVATKIPLCTPQPETPKPAGTSALGPIHSDRNLVDRLPFDSYLRGVLICHLTLMFVMPEQCQCNDRKSCCISAWAGGG